jgi:glucosamine 6-phosphate synthetase-like amidotransferase/phosphosugar isomerase protein
MCGIVGAASHRNIVPVLVQGLQRLEYRGYDSCGVAVHASGLARTAPPLGWRTWWRRCARIMWRA